MRARKPVPPLTTKSGHILTLAIPVAPVGVNGSYKPIVINGHASLGHTTAHSAWQHEVWGALREPRNQRWSVPEREWDKKGLFGVVYHLWLPTYGHDADGRVKGLQDEVFRFVGVPDSRIHSFTTHRYIDKEHPRAIVEIWGLEGFASAPHPRLDMPIDAKGASKD